MRNSVLESNGIKITVRANNLARLYFKQEFDSELDEELIFILNSAKGKEQKIFRELAKSNIDIADFLAFEEALKGKDTDDEAEKLAFEMNIDITKLLAILGRLNTEYDTTLPAFESMRIIWAMAMAHEKSSGNSIVRFEPWLEKVADFDVNDCVEEFTQEVEYGFFRKGRQSGHKRRSEEN